MKKIIVFSVGLILAIGAAIAYAAVGKVDITSPYTLSDPNTNATNLILRPSTNVELRLNSGTSCYAISSGHLNGDRQFGIACDNTALFWDSKTIGDLTSITQPSATGATSFNGWKTL